MGASETEVKAISSEPRIKDLNYFMSPDFSQLADIVHQVTENTCGVVKTTPEPGGKRSICKWQF